MIDLPEFSETYTEAREKFMMAAENVNATLTAHKHPTETGPKGESLFLDVARIGNRFAKRVLVVGSGTHGIEGYAGSAAQIHWLKNFAPEFMDEDIAVLLLHAHNPWGFAHDLRCTEENVDLNRNFVDFDKPLPVNDKYKLVHTLISKEQWNEQEIEETFQELSNLREEIGEQEFSNAFNGGQYIYPDGIFYGGARQQWSNKIFRHVIQENLAEVSDAAIIDLHTGIGPEDGHVFLCFHPSFSEGYQRARAWWGDRAVNREGVTHKAVAHYQGLLVDAFVDMLPNQNTTAVVVEFGTLPRHAMQRASMAARWLWASRTCDNKLRDIIMKEIREAFYPDTLSWRTGVLKQSHEIIDRAIAGLRNNHTLDSN